MQRVRFNVFTTSMLAVSICISCLATGCATADDLQSTSVTTQTETSASQNSPESTASAAPEKIKAIPAGAFELDPESKPSDDVHDWRFSSAVSKLDAALVELSDGKKAILDFETLNIDPEKLRSAIEDDHLIFSYTTYIDANYTARYKDQYIRHLYYKDVMSNQDKYESLIASATMAARTETFAMDPGSSEAPLPDDAAEYGLIYVEDDRYDDVFCTLEYPHILRQFIMNQMSSDEFDKIMIKCMDDNVFDSSYVIIDSLYCTDTNSVTIDIN